MKIILVITQLEFGGAQKALSVLAQGLISGGHDVHLYCFYDKGNFVKDFKDRYGVKYNVLINDYSGNFFSKIFKAAKGVLALFTILKNGSFDILQTFTHYSNIIIPVVSKLAFSKTRVITSQRAAIPPLGKLIVFLDRMIQNSRLVDKMTCVSESIRESCINDEMILANKLVVIPNGISLPQAFFSKSEMRDKLSINQNSVVFLTVARFHEQKGYSYLVEAVKKIITTDSDNYIFVLVGGGDLKQSIVERCISLGIANNVIFLGERNDIPDLLNMSDAFVLPSLWEGMPNSVLEAMASGTCVIATSVDGTKELIDSGIHGILVPPADVDSLYTAISTVGHDVEYRNKLAQCGKDKVKSQYTNESTIAKYIQLYKSEIQS